jgi:tripartite-type tricarboxylate transporter receptor subunit TctC
MKILSTHIPRLLAATILGLALNPSLAQTNSNDSYTIVAPVPAGGGVDFLSRAFAHKLSEVLGANFIVENKPGASAGIGTQFVAKSKPDGRTLLMGYSALATSKFLVTKLLYDLEADLIPVAYIGYIPLMLVVPPSSPFNSVKDLIDFARNNPGKLSYASGGVGAGAHLSGELFKSLTKTEVAHIPYKGNAPALNDLLGGHVGLMFDTITTALPNVKANKLKALATTGPTRSAMAPDIPTMIEAGLPTFEVSAWYMIFAPKKTPIAELQKINAAINKVIGEPKMRADMLTQGVVLTGGSLADSNKFLEDEVDRWGKIIKAANIKAE